MPTTKWVETLKNYADKAAKGDRYAIRFFADYLLGKPVERQIVSVGVMDARERELLTELSELYRSMGEVESDDTTDDTA